MLHKMLINYLIYLLGVHNRIITVLWVDQTGYHRVRAVQVEQTCYYLEEAFTAFVSALLCQALQKVLVFEFVYFLHFLLNTTPSALKTQEPQSTI